MNSPATIKMLQELGAFILAGANGPADVRTMTKMICDARGWRWLGVYKHNGSRLQFVAGSDHEPPCYKEFPDNLGLCGAAVESRETVIVNDVRKDTRYLPTFHHTLSEIVVPVISSSDRVVGVLVAESEKLKAFTKEDREVLERVAFLMGQSFK